VAGSLLQDVQLAIAAHRDALARRFGYADLEVGVSIDDDARLVSLRGRVLARRFAPRVTSAVQSIVPPGWTVDGTALEPRSPGPWHAIAIDPTALLAAIPGDGRRAALATKMRPADGPVQLLAEHRGFRLVRATDGTIAWTDAPLGEPVAPPRSSLPVSADPQAFVAAVRAYMGAPYELGGTTSAGIDCSGLVQRAVRDASAGLVPRHSSDQLAIDPRPGPGEDAAGDLVFVWTSAEAPCHVGVADGSGAVLHASRGRGVVSDARADVLATASRASHVPWSAIVALQHRAVGTEALDDVLELGRPVP
jgi:cell wall-associated NlpC family hydrolase